MGRTTGDSALHKMPNKLGDSALHKMPNKLGENNQLLDNQPVEHDTDDDKQQQYKEICRKETKPFRVHKH